MMWISASSSQYFFMFLQPFSEIEFVYFYISFRWKNARIHSHMVNVYESIVCVSPRNQYHSHCFSFNCCS